MSTNGTTITRIRVQYHASVGEKVEVAKLPIEHGADVNCPDRTGWTPLHAALRHGHVDAIHTLLSHEVMNDKNETLLLGLAKEKLLDGWIALRKNNPNPSGSLGCLSVRSTLEINVDETSSRLSSYAG
jgi:ankyrin repeat protein